MTTEVTGQTITADQIDGYMRHVSNETSTNFVAELIPAMLENIEASIAQANAVLADPVALAEMPEVPAETLVVSCLQLWLDRSINPLQAQIERHAAQGEVEAVMRQTIALVAEINACVTMHVSLLVQIQTRSNRVSGGPIEEGWFEPVRDLLENFQTKVYPDQTVH